MFLTKRIYLNAAFCSALTFFPSFLLLPAYAYQEQSNPAQTGAKTAESVGNPEKGIIVFRRHCSACHYADNDKNKIGPSLKAVFGYAAGQNSGYNYSTAMKKAGGKGLLWTEENLQIFLQSPQKLVPGTRMPPVLPHLSAQDLSDLLRYLASITGK